MRMRKLGGSDIEASVVALGTWAFGGWMWGGTDKKASINALHAALDAGINFIDTAPVYGFGLSEEIVGAALEGRRDDAVLATKCGMVANTREGRFKFNSTAAGYSENGHIGIYINLSPGSIRTEVEGSLRRLNTDYIDLYQTHWQEDTTPVAETMATLLDLKKEGKIRAIGASNATSAQMQDYLRSGSLDSDQERYSMLERGIEEDQLPFCEKNNISVLAYSPLDNGLLTGKIGPEREFGEGDIRKDNPRFGPDNLRGVAAMIEAFAPVIEAHGITPAQLAVAWTLHRPGLTHALCGARNPAQAIENAGAGDVVLDDNELALIDRALNAFDPE